MTPLLALESGEGYVAGAYLAFLALLLIYVAIMAGKLQPHPARASASSPTGRRTEADERRPTSTEPHERPPRARRLASDRAA